jgi:hypothetical protein
MSGCILQPVRPERHARSLAKRVMKDLTEEQRQEVREFVELTDRIDSCLQRLGLTWRTATNRRLLLGEKPSTLSAFADWLAGQPTSPGDAS